VRAISTIKDSSVGLAQANVLSDAQETAQFFILQYCHNESPQTKRIIRDVYEKNVVPHVDDFDVYIDCQ
jgi:hypothetical protein